MAMQHLAFLVGRAVFYARRAWLRWRYRHGYVPHCERHLWDIGDVPPSCFYCCTQRTKDTEGERCHGSSFFRRAAWRDTPMSRAE